MRYCKTLVTSIVVFVLLSAYASAGLILELKAANYNPATGVWTDTSGMNNHATQSNLSYRPALVPNMTLNGSPALYFDGVNDYLQLTNNISIEGFTIFAYVRPAADTDYGAIVGGGVGCPEYRINKNTLIQDLGKGGQAGVGSSMTGLSTTEFSVIDVRKIAGGGGSFRLNFADDGSFGGTITFSSPINQIGRVSFGSQDRFKGYICEIRIYNDVTVDRLAVEQDIWNTYVIPEPSTYALLACGLISLLCYAWKARRRR